MRSLVADGEQVRMVNRSGKASVPGGVDVARADVFDAERLRDAVKGATVVYQCTNPPYHKWPELFPPLQGMILEAAVGAGARLVLAENLYAYGDTDGKPLTEDLPLSATTRKGRTRAMMTEQALEAHREGLLPVTIGRGSDFFGPHVLQSALGERVFPPALRGKSASVLGNIDLPHSYTYIDDFGKALALLGRRDDAFGRAWHVPNAPAVSTREFMTMMFETLEKPPKLSVAGAGLLRFAGIFSPGAREMIEMMYEFTKPFVVDSSAFEQTFGMRATPLREAIAATIAWYRARP
jgi:nucleoside-diphosphate-sugar epimerase